MMRYRIGSVALLVASLTLVGCGGGGGGSANARVSGSLTYKGQPIKAAVMQFHTPSGSAFEAQVSSDGTYQATDIAPGELVVTVDTDALAHSKKAAASGDKFSKARMEQAKANMSRPDRPGGGGQAAAPEEPVYIKIPTKYANAKTSPLIVTLKPGRQVQNIELTD